MKMTPVANGATPVVNPFEGRSADPDRLAKAKAIASGVDPATIQAPSLTADPQVERTQGAMRRLKMRTQASPDRHNRIEEITAPTATDISTPQEAADSEETDKMASTEQADAASEATKPLSPQFAALAREKREVQLERQKLEAEKQALSTQSTAGKSLEEYKARIKANALSVLQEEGVTYDQLTEQILASNQEKAEVEALRAEVKALKDGFDTQSKSLSERDIATENQVKAQIRRNVDQLISQGDDFEMIREAGYAPKVVDLIDQVWKKEGILLDESEAASEIEKELLEESLKWAKLKKVQSRLSPAQSQQTQPVQQDRGNTKVMRTITNRDGVSSTSMSKRERAIAAMEGRLTK